MPMVLVMLGLIFGAPVSSYAGAQSHEASVVLKLSQLTQMREALSATLDGRSEAITEETFKNVCAPVGKELKAWSEKSGYRSRQVSEKYRNPNHAPNSREIAVLKRFSADPKLEKWTEKGELEGRQGDFVYVSIHVAKSCLHCHGEMDKRPDFVKVKYKEDKAFGFRVGDLRGMYSVFVPLKAKAN